MTSITRKSFSSVLIVLPLAAIASVAWTIICGQDMNFDLITYHYYLGYSAFVPRLHLDFLPAGVYGYQSPLPFASLYWLDSIGTPPVVTASLHAAFHALNLVFLYLLTQTLFGQTSSAAERAVLTASWLLGAVAPIYWVLVGSSSADILTSAPVLAGLWLTARAVPGGIEAKRRCLWIAAGGALMGLAVGARIHNSIYVAALVCALTLTRFKDWHGRLQAISAFSLAALAGWLLCFGPRGYELYREHGSPFFPLFNGIFRSRDFPVGNLPLISFIPSSLGELIGMPYWMGTDTPWVYFEMPLPDVRPALFAVAVVAFAALFLFRRTMTKDHGTATPERRLVLIFFTTSVLLWFLTSANGRFGVALFLLGGPVCGLVLYRFLTARHVVMILACAVLWQLLLQQTFFRQQRFDSIPWTTRYFDWSIPERLKQEPATFLSLGFQPASTLIPYLHPSSSHINLSGYPAVDAPGSARIRRMVHEPGRPLYAVLDVRRHDPKVFKTSYRPHLALWGLAFTDQKCMLVALNPPAAKWKGFNDLLGVKPRLDPPAFLVCPLTSSHATEHQRALSEYRRFVRKLSRFGAGCPEYFGKPLGFTYTDKGWSVTSFASAELRLAFLGGRIRLTQIRPPHVSIELGRITENAMEPHDADCRRWFSKLSELSKQAARYGIRELPK